MLRDGVEPACEAGQDDRGLTDAFYPLTTPLTVGPGAISVAIALGSEWPERPTDITEIGLLCVSSIAGLAAIPLTVFMCLQFADRMVSLLGRRGISVLMHLSAFILLCIGAQIISSVYIALTTLPRDSACGKTQKAGKPRSAAS